MDGDRGETGRVGGRTWRDRREGEGGRSCFVVCMSNESVCHEVKTRRGALVG